MQCTARTFSKLIQFYDCRLYFAVIILISSVSCAKLADEISESISVRVKYLLIKDENYTDKAECMTKYLIDNKTVEKFSYSPMSDKALKRLLLPYFQDAKDFCIKSSPGWFAKLFKSCVNPETDDE